ncbi:MAG: ubiquinone biosynthesis protein [Aphanocapsa sp. GSE-SYN-MK-11-07L]|jgi:ubiquinone biosynthesis protein Coq4|nr:ubiquinone biosynthesis protein [Aphanocapsa sp. GSE-SYN-MK-11-07L]
MQLLNSVQPNPSTHSDVQQQTQSASLNGFRSFFVKLIIFKSFVSMLLGDNSLQTVGDMTDGLLQTPAYDLIAQHLNQDPACATLIRDRYIPPAHDLETLLTYPHGSLGYIYAATMKKSGFDPNLHTGMTAESDAQYIELRLSQTHDLWHIVTGFDRSLIGEIGLQAFHLPQFPYPLATMLVANSLIATTLFSPHELPQLLAAIAQGWQMGKLAKPLFAHKWEEAWEKPLAEWQAELNIQPIQHR